MVERKVETEFVRGKNLHRFLFDNSCNLTKEVVEEIKKSTENDTLAVHILYEPRVIHIEKVTEENFNQYLSPAIVEKVNKILAEYLLNNKKGFREYLLEFGEFKDVDIEEDK